MIQKCQMGQAGGVIKFFLLYIYSSVFHLQQVWFLHVLLLLVCQNHKCPPKGLFTSLVTPL